MATTRYITQRRMEYSATHGCSKHIGLVKLLDGTILSRSQVLAQMRDGTVFYTYVVSTGHQAEVLPRNCSQCYTTYLTTAPDAWKDDNLDNLPEF